MPVSGVVSPSLSLSHAPLPPHLWDAVQNIRDGADGLVENGEVLVASERVGNSAVDALGPLRAQPGADAADRGASDDGDRARPDAALVSQRRVNHDGHEGHDGPIAEASSTLEQK